MARRNLPHRPKGSQFTAWNSTPTSSKLSQTFQSGMDRKGAAGGTNVFRERLWKSTSTKRSISCLRQRFVRAGAGIGKYISRLTINVVPIPGNTAAKTPDVSTFGNLKFEKMAAL